MNNFQNSSLNFRTDLADERRDVYAKANKIEDKIEGIETNNEEVDKNIKISTVKILNENGAKAIGKPVGTYITIDVKNIKIAGPDEIQKASETLSSQLKPLINTHITNKDDILVVGLGNIYVTPDALGPKVINEIDVTRHLIKYLPQYVDENTRPVSAVAPRSPWNNRYRNSRSAKRDSR